MFYYLILALQGYCIYHLIKNRNSYYWIFLILFIPVIGSIIYIVTQVFNKNDVEKIQSELTTIINPTKKVKDLEAQLQFSETFQNRVNLADAYFEIKDFNNSAKHYQACLKDNFKHDIYVIKQLIASYFELNDYENVIFYSEKIKNKSEFENSVTQFIYGLSLDKVGRTEEAEVELRKIDKRFSNYNERLILAEFLLEKGEKDDAKEILQEISIESQHMNKDNKRIYRATIAQVEKLLKEI